MSKSQGSTSPTTPLSTHQSTDLGELYNFVVGVEVNGWVPVYDFGHFRRTRKDGEPYTGKFLIAYLHKPDGVQLNSSDEE